MKNIENFNVSELTKNELSSIFGGGFWKRMGRTAGMAWCAVKDFVANMDNHAALGHVTGSSDY